MLQRAKWTYGKFLRKIFKEFLLETFHFVLHDGFEKMLTQHRMPQSAVHRLLIQKQHFLAPRVGIVQLNKPQSKAVQSL